MCDTTDAVRCNRCCGWRQIAGDYLMVLGGGWHPLAAVTSSRACSPLQGVLQRQTGVSGEEVGLEGSMQGKSRMPFEAGSGSSLDGH